MKKNITTGLFSVLFLALLLVSCVSKKAYLEIVNSRATLEKNCGKKDAQIDELNKKLMQNESKLLICENNLGHAKNKATAIEKEVDYLKSTNNNIVDVLSDLSVVSKSGAASIKNSLEALNEQNKYIRDLNTTMRRKDSLNLVLVMNLKRSLSDVNDEDVSVEVKKGVVYISLSDKMMFKSGSSQIQPDAEVVLSKIAKVVKDHQNLDILVEGHTDNVPIKNDCVTDNWDLSVKRATAVVRSLQQKYGVKPERMTAGGRSQYVPKASNETVQGKNINRRTEIIILPKLDEFFQLLAPEASKGK